MVVHHTILILLNGHMRTGLFPHPGDGQVVGRNLAQSNTFPQIVYEKSNSLIIFTHADACSEPNMQPALTSTQVLTRSCHVCHSFVFEHLSCHLLLNSSVTSATSHQPFSTNPPPFILNSAGGTQSTEGSGRDGRSGEKELQHSHTPPPPPAALFPPFY